MTPSADQRSATISLRSHPLQQRFQRMMKPIAVLTGLPRLWKRAILIAFDALALAAALWASFALRYGQWTPPTGLYDFLLILSAPLVAIPIFVRLGLYRAVIRYLPERALWTTVKATTLAALCWVLLIFLSQVTLSVTVPRSVPILYWALASIVVVGSRFIAKKLLWPSSMTHNQSRAIAIYGAGSSGAQLVNAYRRENGEKIVALIDDNPSLHGQDVAGVRVFPRSHIKSLIDDYGLDEIVLSIPSLAPERKREIIAHVSAFGLKVRSMPAISDLISGKYLVSQIREIDIDELLGRSSVPADKVLLREMIEGRTIMVTGAGGSIGSELCRLIAKWAPQRIVLFEASEFALYQIERELAAVEGIAVVPVLGTIVDDAGVRRAIGEYAVQVVFHAAAYKHVPLVEANAIEGIRNNVFGTKVVAAAAYEMGVKNFVLISSDKAVRPTNVMGATKRWAELIVHQFATKALAGNGGQRFTAVRFGNVLGSNGSVVPLFKEQIAKGGPVTVTDLTMTRYFMSIHEASELIVQAGALSEGGDVFLLDMGEPVLIKDLAENMIQLAGMKIRNDNQPDGDIEIVVTGKRPGEKMYEELFYEGSDAITTRHPKIMKSKNESANDEHLAPALNKLKNALDSQDEKEARRTLFHLIAEPE
jgi:FlaA1/EpsC-like NDP-sugar epimerase